MSGITVTPVYAGLITLLMVVLSARVALLRGKHGVALGDGGQPELALGIRRFGNLSEYAAMAIVMLLLMEARGIETPWLHLYGATLVGLRILHPIVLFESMDPPMWKRAGRFVSAAGTAVLLATASIVLLLQ